MRTENDTAQGPRWHRLGDVVHHRRLTAKLTLAQLAEQTALSQSFLSQLENGRTNTSLRSLQRIADALDTTATDLLAEADTGTAAVIVRAGEDTGLSQAERDGSVRALVHGSRDLRALEFTGGTDRGEREFTHDNDELIYVVRGTITVADPHTETTLTTGDTYYCESGVRHRWWAHTDDTVTLVVAVADGLAVRRRPHRTRG
ncbi:helix-turn-helix domain-containing protein [Nocardia jejuensis]|uniref:helix-turn-helix domain-containing protein n=1 Tax=Nocardia jejuensis TaxID=328049 RepID=UPI00082DB805|nr:cupin domain-containing protein [Nocardia jejuensis]